MPKKKVDRDIIILLGLTLMTLVSWVGFEVYRAYTQVPVPAVLEKHLRQLSPVLDTTVLDEVERRIP